MTFISGRLAGMAEGVLGNLKKEKKRFVRNYRDAAEVAAHALAAMKDIACGYGEDIRCEHSRRFRLFQLDGTKRLPLEDLIAIAFAHPMGKAAVLAGLRVVLAALGYDITPRDAKPKDAMSEVGALVSRLAAICAAGGEAMGDGRVDGVELALLAARLPEVEEVVARVKAIADAANGTARA